MCFPPGIFDKKTSGFERPLFGFCKERASKRRASIETLLQCKSDEVPADKRAEVVAILKGPPPEAAPTE